MLARWLSFFWPHHDAMPLRGDYEFDRWLEAYLPPKGLYRYYACDGAD